MLSAEMINYAISARPSNAFLHLEINAGVWPAVSNSSVYSSTIDIVLIKSCIGRLQLKPTHLVLDVLS